MAKDKGVKGKIGLEIHAYVVTKQKLFCECLASREKGINLNINICPICTGQPGAKPMHPNGEALKKAVQIGLMLGCKINKNLRWMRKHYDWPDLPKGYQTTISGANSSFVGVSGKFGGIGIWEMHLEEDPAAWTPETGCVDYNRSGLPLVEIVTAPDFSNSGEVILWLKKLVHNLNYLRAIDSNAGIKVDVNVNLPGKTERVEIKNLNSLESIENAINYELSRQEKEGGRKKETRRWDDIKGKTMVMREKEAAEDYRFILEPDLPEITLDDKFISALGEKVPESPEVKLIKVIKKYKIDKKNAEVLTKNLDVVEFFEKVAEKIDAKFALPWVTIELLRVLNDNKTTLDKTQIKAEHFIALLDLVKSGKITELQGKQTIKKFYPKSFAPSGISERITDKKELEAAILKVIKANPKAVADFKSGEKNAFNFLMGELMKETQKRADFRIARELFEKILKKL